MDAPAAVYAARMIHAGPTDGCEHDAPNDRNKTAFLTAGEIQKVRAASVTEYINAKVLHLQDGLP